MIVRSLNYEPQHNLDERGATFGNYVRYFGKYLSERASLAGADAFAAITPADRGQYVRLGRADCSVLPLRALPSLIRPPRQPRDTGTLEVFFFGSNYAVSHNRAALRFILERVVPEIRRRAPGAFRFHLLGGKVPPDLASIASDDVRIHGFVDDLDAALDGMDAAFIPSLHGGGMQQKIFEPLCRAFPCVTSSRGLAGYPVRDGEHALLADTEEACVSALLRLRDASVREKLSAGAHALAVESIQPAAAGPRRQRVASPGGRGPRGRGVMAAVAKAALRGMGRTAPLRAPAVALVGAAIRGAGPGRVRDTLIGPVTTYLLPADYRRVVTLSDGTRLHGDARDILTRTVLYFGAHRAECWEPQTTRLAMAIAREGGAVIVGGAHVGALAIRLARAARAASGLVLAFEPEPTVYRELAANVALNDVPNLAIRQAALGGAAGTLPFYVQGIRSSLVPPTKGAIVERRDVAVVTIDEALAGSAIDRVGLVLLDIEGGELDALRGAGRLLARPDAPDVLFEIIRGRAPDISSPEGYLASLGYSLFYIDDDYDLELRDESTAIRLRPLDAARPAHRYINVLATRRPGRLPSIGAAVDG